ncbi:MAG: hypothetical protein OEV94_02180 [Deltaproteobacteria bacterium]|nr:hypothetical protein [Deltaproteobacteria bacterium]
MHTQTPNTPRTNPSWFQAGLAAFAAVALLAQAGCGGTTASGGGGGATPAPVVPAWQTPATRYTGAISAINPQMAMDASNNVFLVWQSDVGAGIYAVFVSIYNATTATWSAAAQISTGATSATLPQVAVDTSTNAATKGDAVVVWQQDNGSAVTHIWASHYSVAAGAWTVAQQIEFNTLSAVSPKVVSDRFSNDFLIVWTQPNLNAGNPTSIWYNFWDSGWANWGTEGDLSASTVTALNPSVATDGLGNAMVVYQENSGVVGIDDIKSKRHTWGAATWGTAAIVDNQAFTASNPQVGMDATGNALVVWEQGSAIQSRWYNKSTNTWNTPVYIETTIGTHSNPRISMLPSGTTMAVWEYNDGTNYKVFANKYTVTTITSGTTSSTTASWGTETALSTGIVVGARNPVVALNSNGTAVALWQMPSAVAVNNINAIRYSSSAWGTAAQIDAAVSPATSDNPMVVIDASGNSWAAWQQGGTLIMSAQYK